MDQAFAIGVRAGRQARARRTAPARGQHPSSRRWLFSGMVLGLALLSACTVRFELGEHRFAKGDLAAVSMGLAARERWVGRLPDEAAPSAPQQQIGSRQRGRMPEPDAARSRDPARTGVRLVTLTDDLALAGPDSLARLIASLSGGGSVAPALGPPEIHLAASTAGRPTLALAGPRPAPRPSPKKPRHVSGPTWVPEPAPSAPRAQALRRGAPSPPLPRPSSTTSPGWHLG